MVCGGGGRGLERINQVLIFLFDFSRCLFFVSISVSHFAKHPPCTSKNNEGGQKYEPFSFTSWNECAAITYPNVRLFKERFPAAGFNDGALCEVLMMWMNESGHHKPVDGSRGALLKLHPEIRLNCLANWTCLLAVAPIYAHSVLQLVHLHYWNGLLSGLHRVVELVKGGRMGTSRLILYK